MRIGIGIGEIAGTAGTIENLIAQAKQAEADGFASGWFANIFSMDAIIAATVCADRDVGSARHRGRADVPAPPSPRWRRQPLSAAGSRAGRFSLASACRTSVIEGMLGRRSRSRTAACEYLAVLGPLVAPGR
jgi:hypothetical protein